MIYSESNVNELIEQTIQQERERCAKIAEGWQSSIYPIGEDVEYSVVMDMLNDIPKNIAEAIREQEK